jgi:hypothetical protein
MEKVVVLEKKLKKLNEAPIKELELIKVTEKELEKAKKALSSLRSEVGK